MILRTFVLLLLSLSAFAAAPVTLPSSGFLGVVDLKAGESVVVNMPKAVACIDFGVYEKAGSNPTAGIDIVGAGYKVPGSVKLTHFYGATKSVTITARVATGGFHVVYKQPNQSTCLKLASRQKKA